MTLAELSSMTTDQMVRWLIDDARSDEREYPAVYWMTAEALTAGTIADDVIARWRRAEHDACDIFSACKRTEHA